MKKNLLITAVAIVTLLGFTHCTNGNDRQTAEKQDVEANDEAKSDDFNDIPLTSQQVEAVDLKMDEVANRELDACINANGTLVLRAQNTGEVTSLMGGVVKTILVKEGQHVGKGQVVATVENTEVVALQRDYFSASKEAQLARTELQRQQLLQQNGGGVRKTLEQSEKQYRVAEATLTGIGRQLMQMGISTRAVAQGRFTTVFPLRAPISGTVAEVKASLGSYADMQTPLMKIRNNNDVECDLNVLEKDLAKVKVGDKVQLSLVNQQGQQVSGHVYGMNEYFNEGTKTVAVHVKIDHKGSSRIFDGMYVSGKIATGRQLCKALPTKAIVSADGKKYIFALNGQPSKGRYSFSRHEVTTGVSEGGYTEVQLCKHIGNGQKVVTENAFYLASLTGDHGEED